MQMQSQYSHNWFLIDSWWHAYDDHGNAEPYSLYFEDVPQQVGLIFPGTLKKLKLDTSLEFGAHWSNSFSSKTPYRKLVDNGHVSENAKVRLSVYQ